MSAHPGYEHLIRSMVAKVGRTTYTRGKRYAEAGAVLDCDFDDDSLVGVGTIAGTHPYEALIKLVA